MSRRKKRRPGVVRVVHYTEPRFSRTRPALDSEVNWENLGRVARMGGAAARHGRRVCEYLSTEDRRLAERPVQAGFWREGGRSSRDASGLTPDPEKLARGVEAIDLVHKYGWKRAGEILRAEAEAREKAGRKEAE